MSTMSVNDNLVKLWTAQVEHSVQREFRLVKPNTTEMRDLRKIFEKILVPLYGSQEDALNKIGLARDRVCYLLYEINVPLGVIAFKTIVSNEFEKIGVKNSIEIKSLFVVESGQNSGKGIGSMLLEKVAEEIKKLKIKCNSIHVTVSETKPESLNFFKKKEFRIINAWDGKDKYIKGVTEYLLSRPQVSMEAEEKQRTEKEAKSANEVERKDEKRETSQVERKDEQKSTRWAAKVLFVVHNAHWDDIHSLKSLSDGTFVSGSKDNTLRKWNQEGIVVKEVYDVEPRTLNEKERNWITAAAVVNDDFWVSGDRSGRVRLWTTAGDFVKSLSFKLPGKGHISAANNQRRINCLAAGVNKKNPCLYAGFPTMFSEYNMIAGKTTSLAKVHKNDWVYCVHPLTETRNLVVTAGTLDIWEKFNEGWKLANNVIPERKKIQGKRCHISVLTPLESSPNHFGTGVFGGFVQVVDIEACAVVKEWREHSGRIWAVENVSRDVFASSSEEGLVKVWDARLNKSVMTLPKHVGGVTTLLRIKENVLVAGACQLNPVSANEGAQLLFYDIRA